MGIQISKMSIEEWISFTQVRGEKPNIPITLHSTSGSMMPAVRTNVDAVIVVPCEADEVQIGDIVLINTNHKGAGVILHRLFKNKDGFLITLGDNMKSPDMAVSADMLLGRAISITGPGKNIDCDAYWRRLQGRIIVRSYRLRPILFFIRKMWRKLCRTFHVVK